MQAIAPSVDAVAAAYAGRLKVTKVNVDQNGRRLRASVFGEFQHCCFSRAARWPIKLWGLCRRL